MSNLEGKKGPCVHREEQSGVREARRTRPAPQRYRAAARAALSTSRSAAAPEAPGSAGPGWCALHYPQSSEEGVSAQAKPKSPSSSHPLLTMGHNPGGGESKRVKHLQVCEFCSTFEYNVQPAPKENTLPFPIAFSCRAIQQNLKTKPF